MTNRKSDIAYDSGIALIWLTAISTLGGVAIIAVAALSKMSGCV